MSEKILKAYSSIDEKALKEKYKVHEVQVVLVKEKSPAELVLENKDTCPTKWVHKNYHPNLKVGNNFLIIGFYRNGNNGKDMKVILPVKEGNIIEQGNLDYKALTDLYGAKAECLENYLKKAITKYNSK